MIWREKMADSNVNSVEKCQGKTQKGKGKGKKEKKVWTQKEEELLISKWPEYPCLFKTNSAEFHRLDRKIAARNAIKTALNLELEAEFEDEDIKTKMRNLRNHYGKELGKVEASKQSGAGTNEVYVPTWKYFSQLEFLRDSITPFKTRPTPGISPTALTIPSQQREAPDSPENDPIFQSIDEENIQPITGMMATPKSAKSAAKEKEACENRLLEKSFSVLEQVSNNRKRPAEVEDGDSVFGKHVTQSLRGIKNRYPKEKIKLQIQQLLFSAEFGSAMQGANLWDSPSTSFIL